MFTTDFKINQLQIDVSKRNRYKDSYISDEFKSIETIDDLKNKINSTKYRKSFFEHDISVFVMAKVNKDQQKKIYNELMDLYNRIPYNEHHKKYLELNDKFKSIFKELRNKGIIDCNEYNNLKKEYSNIRSILKNGDLYSKPDVQTQVFNTDRLLSYIDILIECSKLFFTLQSYLDCFKIDDIDVSSYPTLKNVIDKYLENLENSDTFINFIEQKRLELLTTIKNHKKVRKHITELFVSNGKNIERIMVNGIDVEVINPYDVERGHVTRDVYRSYELKDIKKIIENKKDSYEKAMLYKVD
jgi:hypothetical protein